MPLTLTLTEGVLPAGSEKTAIARITEAFLKHHGMADNQVMADNVTAHFQVLPRSNTFAGGKEVAGAWVEWKTPSFALANRQVQQGFFADATEIIHELSGARQPRDRIYVNVVHAVDGGWNFNGKAMTNAEIGAAVANS
jgi:phenylpyruvate tautomerase PptA (4-oxalocrotonate tautomerase family)